NLLGTPTTSGGNFLGGDPLLGRLQANGGPLVGALAEQVVLPTEAPLANSPVIGTGVSGSVGNDPNTGMPLTTDERGPPRTVNKLVALGAVELQPPPPITPPVLPPVVMPAAVPTPTLIPNADVPAGTVLSGNQVVVLLTTGMHKGKKVHRLLVLNNT